MNNAIRARMRGVLTAAGIVLALRLLAAPSGRVSAASLRSTGPGPAFSISPAYGVLQIKLGQPVVYYLTLKNLSSGYLTLTTAGGSEHQWPVQVAPTQVSLPAGGSTTIRVKAQVP